MKFGQQLWDVLVVGAGPAGVMAAREAARQGAQVLLVDKASFPRYKVCGGCLSSAALAVLGAAGLGNLPAALGGKPIHQLRLAACSESALIPLPEGAAVSRSLFDAALIDQAVLSGAHFMPQTKAALDGVHASARQVVLQNGEQKFTVQAGVVLAADGLGGELLKHEKGFTRIIADNARVGVGSIAQTAPDFYQTGTIFMACGAAGYVGLVRVEDGQLDIAAVFDPVFIKQAGGPAKAVGEILDEAGFPEVGNLTALEWRGTPALTSRRATIAAERLFVLGDSASYVEPFTGEGITWALASGAAVASLALQAAKRWTPGLAAQWTLRHSQLLKRRQQLCGLVTQLLRQKQLTRAAVGILSRAPGFAAPLVSHFSSPLPVL